MLKTKKQEKAQFKKAIKKQINKQKHPFVGASLQVHQDTTCKDGHTIPLMKNGQHQTKQHRVAPRKR